uniref:ATP-dependent DNA helicase n=1 Tax=Meloidogyne incognita TaxID=6306 RepID=A0A914NWE3_MELIC
MDEAIDTSIYDNTNLNPEQQRFFNLIRASVLDPNTKNKLFFLSGDGGTGKTFLLNYIIYKLREMRLKVLATASTGIAATNFYAGGMTFHSAFRFGINVEPDVIPPVTVDSYFGRGLGHARFPFCGYGKAPPSFCTVGQYNHCADGFLNACCRHPICLVVGLICFSTPAAVIQYAWWLVFSLSQLTAPLLQYAWWVLCFK